MPRIYKPVAPPENKAAHPVQETKTPKPAKDGEKKEKKPDNE